MSASRTFTVKVRRAEGMMLDTTIGTYSQTKTGTAYGLSGSEPCGSNPVLYTYHINAIGDGQNKKSGSTSQTFQNCI